MIKQTTLEDKIKAKARNLLKGYLKRGTGSDSEGNQEQFAKEVVVVMMKIIKTEVNIRLQDIKHKRES